MEVYVYIDESGSIHKNSKTKYFAVGGYFTFFDDRNKIISTYKRINKEVKLTRNIQMNKEIKSYDYTDEEKIEIFKAVQKIEYFCGCSMIFNKSLMKKEIIESNIFFNYSIKLLFTDCIIPLINTKKYSNIKFIVSIDNRNIKVGHLNDLQTYLRTEFCLENFDFKVTYYDSSTNFGVQLADLIINTFYNVYKDKNIVKNVVPHIKVNKNRISLFPTFKKCGRVQKIDYNISEN